MLELADIKNDLTDNGKVISSFDLIKDISDLEDVGMESFHERVQRR